MRLVFALLLWLACIPAGAAPAPAPPPKPLPRFMLKDLPAWSFAFSPDGRWLAGGYSSARIALWDIQTGRLRWRKDLVGAYGEVLAVAFSSDGKVVAFGQNNSTVHPGAVNLYQVREEHSRRVLYTVSSPITALAFSPDAATLACGTMRTEGVTFHNEVNVWRWRRGRPTRTLLWPGGGVLATAFSPDGRFLECAGADGTLLVRDVRRQKQRTFARIDGSGFSTAAFSPDGRTLAAGNGDGPPQEDRVKVWRAGNGRLLKTFRLPRRVLRTVALSPDGRTVAGGYTSGEIALWEVRSGRLKTVLRGHKVLVRVIAFSPDARRMVSGDGDGKVLLWRLKE